MPTDNRSLNRIPRELGYYMPAEGEKHESVWLAWPHDPKSFPEDRIEKVEGTYVLIIKNIEESEKVNLFVKDAIMKERVINFLKKEEVDLSNICFYCFDYGDVWFRDYGPIFIVNKSKSKIAMVHWNYNAWGNKYAELLKDIQIPSIINGKMRLDYFKPGIVLEGGSIDVNGAGLLLTTEQCVLNKNRNPHLGKYEIEEYLINYLGVSHIIWLKNGIVGDDTDGHVDDIARFVNPTTILCAYEEDKADENYSILKENYEILVNSIARLGNSFNIIKLPMPGFVKEGGRRLPASYANFYIGNSVVLVPIFRQRNDESALNIIQAAFPSRRVVGINCVDLLYGFGTIHCVTQQQPAINYF